MKKAIKLVVILLCLGSFTSCSGKGVSHTEPIIQHDAVKVKAEKLREYYSKSIKGSEATKYQRLFFYEFPSRFSQLDSLYGTTDTHTGLLSEFAVEHIVDLFNKITCVPENTYYNKIIALAINGHWEADGINYFLHGLRERAIQNPTLTFKLLESKSDEEINSFWYFYFDGPHPEENIPKEFDIMKITTPKIYALLESSHKEVLKKVDH